MRFSFAKLTVFFTVALLAAPVFAATNVRRTSTTVSAAHRSTASPSRVSSSKSTKKTSAKTSKTSKTSTAAKRKTTSRRPARLRGQQAIDAERVTQIQQALIREHYLNGEASGNWDNETLAAMQKYQSDNGWQTKLMPDSRAIKKLGLGPDYSTAINAKDSSFVDPPPVTSIPEPQAAGFTAASGVNH